MFGRRIDVWARRSSGPRAGCGWWLGSAVESQGRTAPYTSRWRSGARPSAPGGRPSPATAPRFFPPTPAFGTGARTGGLGTQERTPSTSRPVPSHSAPWVRGTTTYGHYRGACRSGDARVRQPVQAEPRPDRASRPQDPMSRVGAPSRRYKRRVLVPPTLGGRDARRRAIPRRRLLGAGV